MSVNSNRLRTLRRSCRMTQAQLAEKLSVSVRYISRIENCDKDIPITIIEKIKTKIPFANIAFLLGYSDNIFMQEPEKIIEYSNFIRLVQTDKIFFDENDTNFEHAKSVERLRISSSFIKYLNELNDAYETACKLGFYHDNSREKINMLINICTSNLLGGETEASKTYNFSEVGKIRIYPLEDSTAHDEMMKFLDDVENEIEKSNKELQETNKSSNKYSEELEYHIDSIWKIIARLTKKHSQKDT